MIGIIMPVTRDLVWATAARSVFEQTHTDWHLFIVTNNKKLATLLENSAVLTTNKITVIFRPEQEKEWAQARNAAMDAAKQNLDIKHFAFIDDDDIWFPNHLEDCLSAYEGGNLQDGVEYKRFVLASFYKIRAARRNDYLNLQKFTDMRDQMERVREEHSAQQPYVSLMRILNPDTVCATALFVHADSFFLAGHGWEPAWWKDGRPMPGEDLRYVQSMLLDGYIPIWLKPPTCANMNYMGKNYVPSGEVDEIVMMGHYKHDRRDIRE